MITRSWRSSRERDPPPSPPAPPPLLVSPRSPFVSPQSPSVSPSPPSPPRPFPRSPLPRSLLGRGDWFGDQSGRGDQSPLPPAWLVRPRLFALLVLLCICLLEAGPLPEALAAGSSRSRRLSPPVSRRRSPPVSRSCDASANCSIMTRSSRSSRDGRPVSACLPETVFPRMTTGKKSFTEDPFVTSVLETDAVLETNTENLEADAAGDWGVWRDWATVWRGCVVLGERGCGGEGGWVWRDLVEG